MLEALILAVIYCCIVLVVAWLLSVLVGMIPAPPPVAGILPTIIWVIAVIVCLLILLRVLIPAVHGLP